MKKICLVLGLIWLSSCGLIKKNDVAVTDGNGTGSFKSLLSAWALDAGNYTVRLDLNANRSGTPFLLVYKFADNSEITCTGATLTGSETSGTYTATSCTDDGGAMSSSWTGANMQTSAGTYANTGTRLEICRNQYSCFQHH